MVCNFILTKDSILPLSTDLSEFDYFISNEDLDDLMSDKSLLNDFVKNLGRDEVIVRPLGSLNDGTYFIHGVEVLKVGDRKW